MSGKAFEVEAEDLTQADQEVRDKTPPGEYVVSEEVLSGGSTEHVQGVAETVEAADEEARKQLPADTVGLVLRHERCAPEHRSLEVESFDEDGAVASAKEKTHPCASIEDIRLRSHGRKGFLGFGKSPAVYQVDVWQPAVVELEFRRRARIRVETAEIPAEGYCQMCGKADSPADKGPYSFAYFCSPDCAARYRRLTLGDALSQAVIIDASAQDLTMAKPTARPTDERPTGYCWSCGSVVPLAGRCESCGRNQYI